MPARPGPKAFDVIAPGKAAPQPTARPIIVTNRPMIKDPMEPPISRTVPVPGEPGDTASHVGRTVLAAGSTATPEKKLASPIVEPKGTLPSDTGPVLVPEDDSTQPAESASLPISKETVRRTELSVDPQPQPSVPLTARDSVPVTADSIADEDKKEDTTDAPQPGDVAATEKAAAEKVADAERAAQEKIIESGQYYLPIADKKHRGVQRAMLVLLLVVLLGLVWLDIALDAGIVHFHGIRSVTHFFSR